MKSLYIHIPFCKNKCKYCGFYSVTSFDEELIYHYLDSLLIDLSSYDYKEFDTVYIGGGTPTVLSHLHFEYLFSKLFQIINYKNIEFTIEANPESLKDNHLKVFENYNVSRVSLGVQSSNEEVLRLLGRIHSFKDVQNAVEMINKFLPYAQINLDLIYDIPTVDFKKIEQSLTDIIKLSPNHISAYSYSFDTEYLKDIRIDNEDCEYKKVVEILKQNKIFQYEISNFAKNEFESKHNINYWQMGEYIGIGVSAHSMIYTDNGLRFRFSKTNNLNEYFKNPVFNKEEYIIGKKEMFKENLIFGLRMKKGIKISKLEMEFDNLLNNFLKKCKILFDERLLEIKGEYLCATKKGYLLLDSLSQFFWDLEL